MCYSTPDTPAAPTLPEYPAPVDMTPMYELQVQNQKFQNKVAEGQLGISSRQLGLSEKQNTIAEDVYGRWKAGYMPVEQAAIKDAKRGIDPAFFEARARNASMQGATPAMIGVSKNNAQRGIKADSPANMGDIRGLQTGLAADMGTRQISERDRINALNTARKGQMVGIGANIPNEVVSGYGSAAGVMGGAASLMGSAGAGVNRANQAASGVMQGVANMQNTANLAAYQNDVSNQMAAYNLQVQQAQAEAAASNAATTTWVGIGTTVVTVAAML